MARKIKRRKYSYQVYCHACHNWISIRKTGFINMRKGRQGNNILVFKCLFCEGKSESPIFGRSLPPRRI